MGVDSAAVDRVELDARRLSLSAVDACKAELLVRAYRQGPPGAEPFAYDSVLIGALEIIFAYGTDSLVARVAAVHIQSSGDPRREDFVTLGDHGEMRLSAEAWGAGAGPDRGRVSVTTHDASVLQYGSSTPVVRFTDSCLQIFGAVETDRVRQDSSRVIRCVE